MHYADYKTILSPKNGMNLYRGCTHGCIYCDSRSNVYQMNHLFEDIEVKRDAIKLLEQELRRKRNPCMIGTGAMTDPYLHAESELQLTRQSLALIDKYRFGVAIQTKSARILRDLDLLKSINNHSKCVVQTTLTTFDEELCKILEPNVSTTAERIEMLNIMKEHNIPTVVWLSPILPFINDTEENLLKIMGACANAKVKGIICFGFGVTLRSGNKEYFFSQLDRHFPGMKKRYIETFGNSYVCNSPNHSHLMSIFKNNCTQHGIISTPEDVFSYLRTYECKNKQLSLF